MRTLIKFSGVGSRLQLIRREVITHSQLSHPNVLPLLGVFRENVDGPPLMVLPLVDNGSLEDYIQHSKLIGPDFARLVCIPSPVLSITFILWMLRQLLTKVLGVTRALLYLHTRPVPVLHGDLHWVGDCD